MRKISITAILLIAVVLFQFCSSTKKAAAPAAVTYETDIRPLVQSACSPCHIAGKGNKQSLDNYITAKDFADEIIVRIQKNPGDQGFMPARKPKLSDSAINVFVEWKKTGLQEK